jgi:hypothetical protein
MVLWPLVPAAVAELEPLTREVLLKGKAQYSCPPVTNWLR